MIQKHGGKVLYSEYSDFFYLFLHSAHWVLMPGGESRPVERILLAIPPF